MWTTKNENKWITRHSFYSTEKTLLIITQYNFQHHGLSIFWVLPPFVRWFRGWTFKTRVLNLMTRTAITKHCLWEIPNGNEQREKPATVILVLFASGLEVTKTIRYLAKLEVSLFQIYLIVFLFNFFYFGCFLNLLVNGSFLLYFILKMKPNYK